MPYCASSYHLTLQIYLNVVHSVYCDLIYKLYQHQQMHNSIYYVFYYSFSHTSFGVIAILKDCCTF